jgi:DNA-binding NarL/FixJ family response regulator
VTEWALTPREREVMTAICECFGSSKVAAHKLGVSSKTVDNLAHYARNKMGARNRIEAVLMWDRTLRGQHESA